MLDKIMFCVSGLIGSIYIGVGAKNEFVGLGVCMLVSCLIYSVVIITNSHKQIFEKLTKQIEGKENKS